MPFLFLFTGLEQVLEEIMGEPVSLKIRTDLYCNSNNNIALPSSLANTAGADKPIHSLESVVDAPPPPQQAHSLSARPTHLLAQANHNLNCHPLHPRSNTAASNLTSVATNLTPSSDNNNQTPCSAYINSTSAGNNLTPALSAVVSRIANTLESSSNSYDNYNLESNSGKSNASFANKEESNPIENAVNTLNSEYSGSIGKRHVDKLVTDRNSCAASCGANLSKCNNNSKELNKNNKLQNLNYIINHSEHQQQVYSSSIDSFDRNVNLGDLRLSNISHFSPSAQANSSKIIASTTMPPVEATQISKDTACHPSSPPSLASTATSTNNLSPRMEKSSYLGQTQSLDNHQRQISSHITNTVENSLDNAVAMNTIQKAVNEIHQSQSFLTDNTCQSSNNSENSDRPSHAHTHFSHPNESNEELRVHNRSEPPPSFTSSQEIATDVNKHGRYTANNCENVSSHTPFFCLSKKS